MGKTLASTFGRIFLLLFVVGAIFCFLGFSQIPDIIADKMSKMLQVSVKIADIDFSLKSIEVEKLEIGNPAGCHLARALGIERIYIETPLKNYLNDTIYIEHIALENVHLGLEFDSPLGTSGNWTTLMNNIQKSSTTSTKNPKKVFIKKIVLTNISTDLLYRSQGHKAKRLPIIRYMELKDISTEGNSILTQLMDSALGSMLKQVFIQQNLKDLLDVVLKNQGGALKDLIPSIKGFLNAAPLLKYIPPTTYAAENEHDTKFCSPLSKEPT